jgi:hypothetical protein
MAEVIRNPGMKDNPEAVESQALVGDNRVLVDSLLLEADRQDSADMVDKQAGSEALLRDAKPVTPIHVRDRWFVDQQVALAQED